MAKPPHQATASAPACVGNVAVGFDFLGHTILGPQDQATIRRIPDALVRISVVRGITRDIPLAAAQNTAGAALMPLRRTLNLPFGFEIELDKGIPLASGMGGSAASCVAALVAANALLEHPVALDVLYQCAFDGESLASGARNGDNIGPMLFGGLVIATPERVVPVPVPSHLHCVLVHPNLQLETRRARHVLKDPYELTNVIQQTINLALVLSGCYRNDMSLIRSGMQDCLIEPRRAQLIPGFEDVKRAALDSHALGASISGAGPSLFAWFTNKSQARTAAADMQLAFGRNGIASRTWVSPVAGPAARVIG
ncbi:MAG: homoserine kinase [Gammaproteobacteria bacterium]